MSPQAEADRRHRPRAEGGAASRRSTALWPCQAGPPVLSLSTDRKAGLGCQGRVQGTFLLWNKCMRKDKELPCLFRAGGGELSHAQPRPLGTCALSHTQRMSDTTMPGMCTPGRSKPPVQGPRPGTWSPPEKTGAWPVRKRTAENRNPGGPDRWRAGRASQRGGKAGSQAGR